jgi:hypothetical protein
MPLAEKGKFKVRELVEVEMLKILPAVPVVTVVMTLPDREIWVEVPIKTFCPPVTDKPLPTVKEPRVEVPIPPLATERIPLTSELPKAMEPLKRLPLLSLRTLPPVDKEEMVVEPLLPTENKVLPEEEEMVKGFMAALAWTWNWAEGVVVLMPTLPPLVTLNMDVPEEEETLKESKVPVPWTLKLTVEEVALTPTTVPLFKKSAAEVRLEEEVQ